MSKQIPLSQGLFAIVDDEDYGRVMQHKWCVKNGRRTNYAIRTFTPSKNVRKREFLHNFLMQPPAGIFIDHINGNGLDCTRANLRYATALDNRHNSPKYRNNTSGYKGVSLDRRVNRWQAIIRVHSKSINVGTFDHPEDAARAYDQAARRYFGEFAHVNFPKVH